MIIRLDKKAPDHYSCAVVVGCFFVHLANFFPSKWIFFFIHLGSFYRLAVSGCRGVVSFLSIWIIFFHPAGSFIFIHLDSFYRLGIGLSCLSSASFLWCGEADPDGGDPRRRRQNLTRRWRPHGKTFKKSAVA